MTVDLRLLRTHLFRNRDMLVTKVDELEANLEKLNDANLKLQKAAERARRIAKQAEINEAIIRDIEENGLPDHLK